MERLNNRDESEKENEIGLSNLDGQFNCFINSVLQGLRTSTIFKNALL
jgi:ubiquitin C-terminal hydrolase